MKTHHSLLGASLLAIFLTFNITQAANNDAQLTDREKALWQEAFGSGSGQSNSQQINQSPEDTINLSGNWVGYYEYDQPQNQPEGMFNVIIKDEGDEFYMTFLEPRNHSSEYARAAIALNQKRQGRYMRFLKSYDPSTTEVEYNLTVRHNGAVLEGTWKIDENVYGRAFFYKVDLQELKEIKQQAAE